MSFIGFSLSLIIGLWVDNPFTTVVSRSVVVLFVFYILGYVLAGMGQKVIVENFEAEAQALTAPVEGEADADSVTEQGSPPLSSATHSAEGATAG